MLDLNLNVVSNHDEESSMVVEKFQLEESGTSHSSVFNADDGSCSKRTAGEVVTFSFDILKAGGESDTFFSGQGQGQSAASGLKWIDMSFSSSNENQAVLGGGGEVRVTQHQSQPVRKSRRGPRSRSSGYRGVTFYRRTGRWESHIWDCGKQVYLGGFDTALAAARVYDRAAIRFRGIGADINFSVGDYEQELTQMKSMSKEEFVHILRRRSIGFCRGRSEYRGVCGRCEARMGHFLGKKAYDKAAINCNGTNFEASTYGVREDGLDLSLGISPPSFGNNPKEVWNNSASFDFHANQVKPQDAASTSPSTGLPMTSWNGIYPDFFSNYKRTRRW